jgi:hypothetical protein
MVEGDLHAARRQDVPFMGTWQPGLHVQEAPATVCFKGATLRRNAEHDSPQSYSRVPDMFIERVFPLHCIASHRNHRFLYKLVWPPTGTAQLNFIDLGHLRVISAYSLRRANAI